VEWTCEVAGKSHSSHIHLTGKNLNVNAQASDSDLYKTIDAALNKLEKQIAKQKNQVKDHIHHKH
jgi:putative sigma-54 modulation protein